MSFERPRRRAQQFAVFSLLVLLGISSAEERSAPPRSPEPHRPRRLPPLRVKRLSIPVQKNLVLARQSNNEFRNPPEWIAEMEKGPCHLRLTKGRFTFPGASLQSQPGQEIPQTFELLCYENKAYQAIGPTIRVRPGAKFKIRVKNALKGQDDPGTVANDPPTYETPHGLCTTNLHTHGLHVSPAGNSDNIFRTIDPQEEFTFEYALRPDHPSGTFWYHPHKHGSVAYQLSNGLAGALIVEGDKKREKNKEGDTIRRLEDVYEIAQAEEKILVVQLFSYRVGEDGDARIDASTIYNVRPDAKSCKTIKVTGPDPADPNNPPRATAINGILVPTIRMAPGEVQRWRIIFASWDELLPLVFADKDDKPTNELQFREIALDGLATGRMEVKSSLELAPGQRSDVLIKAPMVAKGQQAVYFLKQDGWSATQSLNGVPADPTFLAKIVVSGDPKPEKSSLPDEKLLSSCQPFKPVLPGELSPPPLPFQDGILFNGIDLTKTYNINYRTFHGYSEDVALKLGSAQEWTIKAAPPVKDPNDSNSDSNYYPNNHPFHVHVNPFQLIKQIGADGTVTDWETKNVWRDTLLIKGGETYTIRTRILDFAGRTVLHCHILDHED